MGPLETGAWTDEPKTSRIAPQSLTSGTGNWTEQNYQNPQEDKKKGNTECIKYELQ